MIRRRIPPGLIPLTASYELPLPFNVGDRPTYSTQLACCKGAYGGQTSGACLAGLPEPPTQAPAETGGLDAWYPDYGTPYASATCINDRPLPSGRPVYSSQEKCCVGAYGSQSTHACQCAADACYSCKCAGDRSSCPATGPNKLDCGDEGGPAPATPPPTAKVSLAGFPSPRVPSLAPGWAGTRLTVLAPLGSG